MVKVKRGSGLPPNFDDLPRDMQIACEEEVYRRQLKYSHGFCPGSPCLKSMSADGVPISGSFGKRVKTDTNEPEVEE
jgi:hypothetical protein